MPALNWIGKDAVRSHHQEVPFRLLREDADRAVGDPDADNLLVQGDNLIALKALLPYYAGQVKCVYIDPPYNTGNEGWAYNDNVNSPQMRRWLGETVGKEAEDLSRHDKWLCMMYPRVMLLHELLAADGSFWMSIDDNEVHHARALLDEIFGRKNFVASVIWQKVYSPKNSANYFSEDHDYVLVYAKDKENWDRNLLPRTEEQDSAYINPDNDLRGKWKPSDLSARNPYKHGTYSITTPSGREIEGPPTGRYWSISKEKLERLDANNQIWWGKEGDSIPQLKRFLSDVQDGLVPQTLWTYDEVGHTQEAKKELVEICDFDSSGDVFVTPKPTRLIERILEIATDPGDLVLDSFAGTGTTGHAVLKKNAADGYDRRFILVELEEDVAENVTLQRLKRATEGYEYEGTEKTTLMEKEIQVRELKKGNEIYAESEAIKQENEDDYDTISRSMDDGVFTLTGKIKVTDRKEGLGSGMRYATLGPVLMDANGTVRRDVAYNDLARHIHYAETGAPLPADADMNPPLVSQHDGMAIYLLYNGVLGDARPEGGNVLTRSVLNDLPTNGTSGPKIVYGVACRVSETACNQHGVIFRQIPYDVRSA
ncbi:site-specific DNA-methyltransferase [Longimonas halophila]|uniref:site-specific DNA-methyltransferase (adenine-specific) n=1 Tax=Longimonas halophila TaxID=1469170 RepID=A0A2H3NLC3_9BACT|nr:site-specific DNA-methyltransferase [Longimonas halophila]PEN06649.1 site-specific DNA-methyltransferase [Longimonas halophila]